MNKTNPHQKHGVNPGARNLLKYICFVIVLLWYICNI